MYAKAADSEIYQHAEFYEFTGGKIMVTSQIPESACFRRTIPKGLLLSGHFQRYTVYSQLPVSLQLLLQKSLQLSA